MGFWGGCCRWFSVLLVMVLMLGAVGYLMQKKLSKFDDPGPHPGFVPNPPGYVREKYADPLAIAIQFFDVQKSGNLVGNKIPWRGDSALNDGSEAKLDLSKGMYDAGDHMKFGFPMAFTATVLSWAILEYGGRMDTVNHLEPAKDSLRWITDYLLNAHASDNVLYIQVGDPEVDHKCWDRPETMSEKRPLTQINTETPGSDVAAETSAALAAASLVFKQSDSNYSIALLEHSKQLFAFADTHRGLYSLSVPEVQQYYNSTGYGDELLWAAGWLYQATGDKSYFQYAMENGEKFADFGNPQFFSWNNKLSGFQVLMSRLSFFDAKNVSGNNVLIKYRQTAENLMCTLLPNSPTASSSRTKSGLIRVSDWNALQEPVALAFLASLYSDYMITSQTQDLFCSGKSFDPSDLKNFAMSQADYVLGQNPMNMSYLVGYGDNYPKHVHHRGASIPADATTDCTDGFVWLTAKEPNPNVAVGALVGGPFLNETYVDDRNNSMQGEPTTYNSALLVGLLSSLVTSSTTSVGSFV